MARWEPQTIGELNRGVTSAALARDQAKQLEQDIDYWASAVGAANERTFDSPSGRGSFTVYAENQTVTRIDYSW